MRETGAAFLAGSSLASGFLVDGFDPEQLHRQGICAVDSPGLGVKALASWRPCGRRQQERQSLLEHALAWAAATAYPIVGARSPAESPRAGHDGRIDHMRGERAGPRGLTHDGLARIRDVMAGHVEEGGVPGLAWLVAQGDSLHAGTAGTLDLEHGNEVQPDSIFRISSLTKPVTAVAALVLIEECRLRLDDPVDAVLRSWPNGACWPDQNHPEDTVPAQRPITVRGILTFGSAMAWTSLRPRPAGAVGDGGAGPGVGRACAGGPRPSESGRRLGTLPLAHQPGARWLYQTGADVLGVLVARAVGQDFDDFVHERIFEPLGRSRPGSPCRRANSIARPLIRSRPLRGRSVRPGRGTVSEPPLSRREPTAWCRRSATFRPRSDAVGRWHARGWLILSRAAVEAMTTNQLSAEQL